MWVAGTMAVDYLAIGIATPVLTRVFQDTQPIARFAEVPGNFPLLLILLPLSWLFAAFGEEFFFRGFLMTAIAEALGASRTAWITALVLQAIAFGLVHAYQGPVQAISIGIGGAVYGAAFLLGGRNLWPLILAHGLNDTLGFILLFAGVIQQ
jgi:membrane protease YdiL (CAAX protease family)